ncbi:hypothetical protein ID866_9184 [Astraeus odoratus]|nr:hypothetical protein ID866_9184 [Astraeus odoratus]
MFNIPTHTMQMCLHACTQTKCKDAEHYLSGSYQILSTSDHHPPLSVHHLSLTTPHAESLMPHHEPSIRTLADKLDNDYFRTPDGPGGSDPDDNDSDDDDNTSDPSIEENPILALTNTITHLSHTTRCRPKDSGAACTKVCEPNTFNGMDPKKLLLQAFHLDLQKVGFALSFLKGITLIWFKPNLLNTIPGTEPAWANDYSVS